MNKLTGLILVLLLSFGCKEDDPTEVEDTFDKGAMLTNVANNVIIPSYSEWETNAKVLLEAAEIFNDKPNETNLTSLRAAFIEAHKSWNGCSIFEFGPAADQNTRLTINTFPTDTGQIESNISSNDYDLKSAQNADAKGFAAIDYVLFIDDQLLLSDPARAQYVLENAQQIFDRASEISSAWATYKDEFASNTSSSAGSSISNLINELNYEFELVKNARVGIPLGKKTLGVTQVEKLEGFYSDESTQLAQSNIQGIKEAFTGGSGLGLDDYLDDLDAQKDGQKLSAALITLFDEIEEALSNFNLKTSIENNPSELDPVYNKIERLVVLLKTDMPSQLGVQITYQDNDGD